MNYEKKLSEIVNQSELFGVLTQSDRMKLATECPVITLKKRQYVFHEGQSGDSAFLLLAGTVQLIRQTGDGREVVIGTMKTGTFFAEVVLFENDIYPVTALAISDIVLLQIRNSLFKSLLDDAGFRDQFISFLIRKQRYLTQRVRYLTLFDLEERFFRFLGEHYGTARVINPGISRKDLAAAIGATPESLSRLIRRLTEAGRITWKGEILTIVNSTDLLQE